MKKKVKKVIGWREVVSLPKIKVKEIKVKVDTGAATSSLHAEDIIFVKRKGGRKVLFTVYPEQKNKRTRIRAEAEFVEMRHIRSSTGHLTERPVIRTMLKIGEDLYEIELTLVNRDIMGFRMLLGRKALKKKFLVDSGKSFLVSKKV